MKLRRLAALAAAMVLTFGLAGSVFANAANPSGANPALVVGHTVTLTGNWTWASQDFPCGASSAANRNVGWAFDWGDGFTGNFVQSKGAAVGVGFHVGSPQSGEAGFDPLNTDGNTVQTNHDCGDAADTAGHATGTWGPISHTFATQGEHQVCLIMYDIHLDHTSGLPKSGELVAGGTGNNDDNSAETNGLVPDQGTTNQCLPINIVIPKVPSISIDKTVDPTNLPAGGGDVTYTYVVTNTGDLDLHDIAVVDDNGTPADTSDDFTVTCPESALAVGEHMTCTADVSGTTETTTNIATVDAIVGEDTPVTDSDDATVTVAGGGVGGDTSPPKTAPPTDTINGSTNDAGGNLPILLLVLGVIGLGAVVLTPRRAKR